ncbi:MAG TPA: hypothetical protein VKA60_10080 [Blastocatellia bacterium]|nr:hypothetical protein [Blastocatellia bacterium]
MKTMDSPSACEPTAEEGAIILCLAEYWMKEGKTFAEAIAAAHRAVEKMKQKTGEGTWCLLFDEE